MTGLVLVRYPKTSGSVPVTEGPGAWHPQICVVAVLNDAETEDVRAMVEACSPDEPEGSAEGDCLLPWDDDAPTVSEERAAALDDPDAPRLDGLGV